MSPVDRVIGGLALTALGFGIVIQVQSVWTASVFGWGLALLLSGALPLLDPKWDWGDGQQGSGDPR